MSTTDIASDTVSVAAALRQAAAQLRGHSESARLDAEILLSQVLGISRAGLIARDAQMLKERDAEAFDALIARRRAGVPIAYLTESREFWSMSLHVSPAVLVPRPETEILIEQVLQIAPASPARSLLDLGTGSGAIALAVAAERPDWRVLGTDVSPDALSVARANAASLGFKNIHWALGSWFEATRGERFDLIVSNPPYIAGDDPSLAELHAEPRLALTPGITGLEALQSIIAQAPTHLQSGGWLVVEHGHDQAPAVQQLLREHAFESIRTCLDLSGKTRVTLGSLYSTLGKL
jgi:release factor glutamine methyltransferase